MPTIITGRAARRPRSRRTGRSGLLSVTGLHIEAEATIFQALSLCDSVNGPRSCGFVCLLQALPAWHAGER